MRKAVGFLAAAVLALSAEAQRGNPDVSFDGQSIDSMIAAFMREHSVDGMSLAIVQAPYVTRAVGYGVADRLRRTLVSTNTMFDIGQMKDAFTAVAVMQLVEMGKLRLDDTAGAILGTGEEEVVQQLLHDAMAYATLERIVAKASGTTYEQFVRHNQFEPLGLRHTAFGSELASRAREQLAPGERHRRFLKEPLLIDPAEPAVSIVGGAPLPAMPSAIYSSAADISFWDIALAGEVLINDGELRKLLYVPAVENGRRAARIGAWTFPGHEGLMVVTGNANGFSSLLSRFTKSDELVCVTLLANREGVDLTQLARRIAGAHNPLIGPPSRVKGMRVQQSPWSAPETMRRLERALRERGIESYAGEELVKIRGESLRVLTFEEKGEVWVAVGDPKSAETRRIVDAALLEAVSAR